MRQPFHEWPVELTTEYISSILVGMKVKTSVTLSKEVLDAIEKNLETTENRSQFIEAAIVYYLQSHQKSIRDSKDMSILNENFSKLNEEAEDALEFQDV